MPSHQQRRSPLPADYQFPTHQYDANDVHRVDLVIKQCERCGNPCVMTFRDMETADGFRVLTCPRCEGCAVADATGEP